MKRNNKRNKNSASLSSLLAYLFKYLSLFDIKTNWQFDYTGASYGIESCLKRLAAEWSDIPPAVAALNGRVSMFEGNKFHAFITWEQSGVSYTYSVPHSNWVEVVEVLNSAESKTKKPVIIAITGF